MVVIKFSLPTISQVGGSVFSNVTVVSANEETFVLTVVSQVGGSVFSQDGGSVFALTTPTNVNSVIIVFIVCCVTILCIVGCVVTSLASSL